MAEINVPKPPKNAFNPNRPASDLLKWQVEHLEWAVRHAGQRRGKFKVKPVRTEADAAARMASLIPRLASAEKLPFKTSQTPEPAPAKPRRQAAAKSKRPMARRSRKKAKR